MIDWGRIFSWKQNRNETQMMLGRDDQAYNFYDIPPDVLNQVIKDKREPFFVQTINLSTASASPLEISVPGTAIVIRGHDNSATKAVNTTPLINCQFERASSDQAYPLKHNFGFCGVFSKVYLSWPAQTNVYADVIIYKGLFRPWIDGSAAT